VLGAKRWLVTLECGFQPGFCFQRWLLFCGSIPAKDKESAVIGVVGYFALTRVEASQKLMIGAGREMLVGCPSVVPFQPRKMISWLGLWAVDGLLGSSRSTNCVRGWLGWVLG
jgi:hypothetical protein